MAANITDKQRRELVSAAEQAARSAYAPYSNFRVGAAVMGNDGIHVGTNVENASYGLSLCAERSALSRAVATGDRDILAIAVACIDAPKDGKSDGLTPCGACRQWIKELAPKADILILGLDHVFHIDELLPHGFSLR